MLASEGKAAQLKDGMPVGSILRRLGGTEIQVHDVTLARVQAMSLIQFPMIVYGFSMSLMHFLLFLILCEFDSFSYDVSKGLPRANDNQLMIIS